jgi:site-specific DNA recombinase
MKEVIAYCRVARAKESEPSAEVQRQEQMVRRYADARGLIICETYLDADVNGGALERPALQSLLADCRAGKIGTVITQDPERLSRGLCSAPGPPSRAHSMH